MLPSLCKPVVTIHRTGADYATVLTLAASGEHALHVPGEVLHEAISQRV